MTHLHSASNINKNSRNNYVLSKVSLSIRTNSPYAEKVRFLHGS